ALASLTREMASDFGRVGVRVNAIAPGEIDTSILSPGTEKIVDQQIPMHRLGTPDEVAKIVYVLCTETSSYVTGAEIHINGGQNVLKFTLKRVDLIQDWLRRWRCRLHSGHGTLCHHRRTLRTIPA